MHAIVWVDRYQRVFCPVEKQQEESHASRPDSEPVPRVLASRWQACMPKGGVTFA